MKLFVTFVALVIGVLVYCFLPNEKNDESGMTVTVEQTKKVDNAEYCSFQLPKEWKLLYNKHTNEYVLSVDGGVIRKSFAGQTTFLSEVNADNGRGLYLYTNTPVLDTSFHTDIQYAIRRKDSCELKYIASTWLDKKRMMEEEKVRQDSINRKQKTIDSLKNDFR